MSDLLPRLRSEVERAWNARRDCDVVHRLAVEHPSLADELYDFFADMIETEMELGRERPELAAMDDRVREYLDREGYQRAAEARVAATGTQGTSAPMATGSIDTSALRNATDSGHAPFGAAETGKPTTFLALLRHATGESVEALADALEIPPTFLVLVSENGSTVPPRAQRELARRAASARKLNESTLLASFSVAPQPLRQAASRQKAFAAERPNFGQLVNSSEFDAEQRAFWLGLGL